MKCFLMLDLVGTLIEFNHINNRIQPRDKYIKTMADEYQSRINYIGRKLNGFMQLGNIVAIASSMDHCGAQQIAAVLSDIDKVILDENKDKIYYFISDVPNSKKYLVENGGNIGMVDDKVEAYDVVLSKNPGYYPIAIDDNPMGNGVFYKVLKQGGQVTCIFNDYICRDLYPTDFQKLAYKYIHLDEPLDGRIAFNISRKKSEESEDLNFFDEYYEQMHNGTLDVAEVYNWHKRWKIELYLKKYGLSEDEISKLFKHNCISIEPSFEKAYQKRIMPKL